MKEKQRKSKTKEKKQRKSEGKAKYGKVKQTSEVKRKEPKATTAGVTQSQIK